MQSDTAWMVYRYQQHMKEALGLMPGQLIRASGKSLVSWNSASARTSGTRNSEQRCSITARLIKLVSKS